GNIIVQLTCGVGDVMYSSLFLVTEATVYISPGMNVHLYSHPAVMENFKQLEAWGYHFIEPGDGYLACGYVGKVRLEEPESIIKTITEHQLNSSTLANKKVLISAGPTREQIDPVRFFTNRSSGKDRKSVV